MLDEFCEAEVEHFDAAIRLQHDVGRFQIAMDDVPRVRGRAGISHLNGDANDLSRGHRLLAWPRSAAGRSPAPSPCTPSPSVPMSCTVTMFGWLSAEAALASWVKRWSRSVDGHDLPITLTATSRPSRVRERDRPRPSRLLRAQRLFRMVEASAWRQRHRVRRLYMRAK